MRRISTGGFAKIYTVWDKKNQTERILKVLVETSPKALELFDQEASVLASLNHSGIPKVEPDNYFYLRRRNSHSANGHSNQLFLPCLVMEKIDGCTLEDIVEKHPQGCPDIFVIDWLFQAVQILLELHRRKIIHRDIKPSNLMLRGVEVSSLTKLSRSFFHHQRKNQGQLVIIDFGGVKQIDNYKIQPRETVAQRSTTRLISPGYSPPEQITGEEIGPFTDFYALGRTFIHLLTGQYPAELEDPSTGELKWRELKPVNPALADLLDDMVRLDAAQRPATAAEVQVRLAKIYRQERRSLGISAVWAKVQNLLQPQLLTLGENIGRLYRIFFQVVNQIVAGSVDTTWGMIVGGVGGGVGAIFGLILAYWSGVGDRFSDIFTNYWLVVSDVPLSISREIIVFGLAGLGMGVGLTDVGSFGQRRHYLPAALMGMTGYVLGRLCWQFSQAASSVYTTTEDLIILEVMGKLSVGIATGFTTLGLGLKKDRLVYGLLVTGLTAIIFVGLEQLDIFPKLFLRFIFLNQNQPNLLQFFGSIAFFSLLGCVSGFCLGVSHYIVIPILRRLGF
ncbi:MAG: serine/threonine-protein kinase [Okeania sp.]|nr:serine/threonine-protein kinase [Okeania sp.]MEB3340247.1 serine/threonine-protein kinase [Okeania sp.]